MLFNQLRIKTSFKSFFNFHVTLSIKMKSLSKNPPMFNIFKSMILLLFRKMMLTDPPTVRNLFFCVVSLLHDLKYNGFY